MSINWPEISRWAKKYGYKVSKNENVFNWICLETKKNGQEKSVDDLVKKVYNEITGYKHKDHQDNYKHE